MVRLGIFALAARISTSVELVNHRGPLPCALETTFSLQLGRPGGGASQRVEFAIALEHETFGYLHDMMRPRFQELCAAEGGATEGGDWPLEACVGGLAGQMDALVASTCEAVLADEASQESGDWQPVVMASTGQKALSKNIMAYVVATYAGPRHHHGNDPIAPRDYLRLHLAKLATVPTMFRPAVLILRPPLSPGHAEMPGYYDVGREIGLLEKNRGSQVAWVYPRANEGSFANYIYAYESTRSLFEYYLWTEDDYVAVAPLFDLELLHLYARTFGGQGGGQGGVGLLSALLQGQPHEPLQAFGEHQESAMFSSAATMKALFTDTDPGLRGEPPRAALKRIANQLVQEQPLLYGWYFNALQGANGLLFQERGVPQATWAEDFRAPYWDTELLDFGTKSDAAQHRLPLDRILVAPLQWLNSSKVKVCCGPLGITACPLSTSCEARISDKRSCCQPWEGLVSAGLEKNAEAEKGGEGAASGGLFPFRDLAAGVGSLAVFHHATPPPYERAEHRLVTVPVDLPTLQGAESVSQLADAVRPQFAEVCARFSRRGSPRQAGGGGGEYSEAFEALYAAHTVVPHLALTNPAALGKRPWPRGEEDCAADLVAQFERQLDALVPTAARPPAKGASPGGSLEGGPDPFPCRGLDLHEVEVALRTGPGPLASTQKVRLPLNLQGLGSSEALHQVLEPQFLGLCAQVLPTPSAEPQGSPQSLAGTAGFAEEAAVTRWSRPVRACASDLLAQVDDLVGLVGREVFGAAPRRATRFVGLGSGPAVGQALGRAGLLDGGEDTLPLFDGIVSTPGTALALLGGHVLNFTQGIQRGPRGHPFSPRLQALFPGVVICEWSKPASGPAVTPCTRLADFHAKYERERRRLLRAVFEDGDRDVHLLHHFPPPGGRGDATAASPAAFDLRGQTEDERAVGLWQLQGVLLERNPRARLSSLEVALPLLRGECLARIDRQRRVSKHLGALTEGLEALINEAANRTCGWLGG